MSDDDIFSTRRISPIEMADLQKELKAREEMVDITIPVAPELMRRIETLIPKIEEPDAANEQLKYAAALRQILMTGLHALEREFED